MAKNPKIKDPTEVAMSAIQDALSVGSPKPEGGRRGSLRRDTSSLPLDLRADEDIQQPRFGRAANDDRETIGEMLQTIQKGRPRRSAYTIASLFAGLWIIAGGLLTFLFMPALESIAGQEGGGALALVGLAALFLAPLILFYFMAMLARRSQELSLITQSMAQIAVLFSEPEKLAGDSMVSVGQAIRREVAAMGDGVERAITRAGELEALVSNEVSSLERAYSDNEVRIRGLLDDIATQRENLAGEFEQVRNAFSGVQIDLHLEISTISDSITSRVDEIATNIVNALEERSAHITRALSTAGDTVLAQLDLRAADLASKLESLGDQLTDRILVSGDKAADSLDITINTLIAKVVSHTGTAHDALTDQINSFEDFIKYQSAELAERFERDSGTLGALIKGHVAEFDRTVKTYGGEIIERMGQHTLGLSDNLKTYLDTFDDRVTSYGEAIHDKLDQRLNDFQAAVDSRVESLDTTLAGKAAALSDAIETRSVQLNSTMTARFQEMHDGLEIRFGAVSADIAGRVGQFENLLDTRVDAAAARVTASGQNAADILVSRAEEISHGIKTSVEQAGQSLTKSSSHLRTIANDLSKSITTAIDMLGGGLNGRVDAITEGLHNQTERLTQMIDSNRGTLVEAIGAKSAEISNVISSATESALKTIEGHGGAFTVAMMNNSSDLARQINTASDVAIGAVNKSLKDIEESSKAAIDQSRQVATTTVNELQETSKILRTDTLALFEQLREGNILLQEVLTGAHDNLNNLERTLVTRVADFATTMNDLNTRNGSNTTALEEQLGLFNSRTSSALANLGSLAIQFDSHGRALAEAAELIEISNSRTSQSVIDLNAQFESLINTFDTRALDMDEQLNRFTTLLDQSLDAAEMRAHEITQAVAEGAGDVSAAVSHQLQGVRLAVEDERRQTVEAMSEIYDQGTREADMMFRQSADKFASIVHSMKQMAAELHTELESTRVELRKGVLEMPQEAAESTAQMRKVIVDQIEALAELNRIVARHGRGLDVTTTSNRVREEEPMMATAGARQESRQDSRQESRPAPRGPRDNGSASNLPPPEFAQGPRRTDAPSVAPSSDDRDGWLSNMLNRADGNDEPRGRGPARPASGNPLESLALDITRLVDRDLASEMWERYQRGERKAFTKRLYTPAGQKAFEEVARKYRADRNFKATVDRYINEFEKLLDDVSRDERGPSALRNQLASETGLVYTLLAHAAGRLG